MQIKELLTKIYLYLNRRPKIYFYFTEAEGKSADTKGLFVKSSSNENFSEVDKEIDKVLNLFEQTNRQEVPSYVHKLSVFNKPYFTGIVYLLGQ